MNPFETFRKMSSKERIEIKTMLDKSTAFTGCVIRAEALREISNDATLRACFTSNDLIFYRTVSKMNDVYSFKTRTISLHPSTYEFLREGECQTVLTFCNDKYGLFLSKLEDFDTILDLGIGYLRRADFFKTQVFQNAHPLSLNTLFCVKNITTPPVKADAFLDARPKQIVIHDPNQRGLFDV